MSGSKKKLVTERPVSELSADELVARRDHFVKFGGFDHLVDAINAELAVRK